VVIQVAAALVLVVGATLLGRSFAALAHVPLGAEAEGVLTFEVHLPGSRYPDREARDRFHARLQERIASLPGVEASGATSWLPLSGRYHTWGFYWNPQDPSDRSTDEHWYGTDVRVIAGDYFGALGIDVLRGASSRSADPAGPPVAWVNRTLADEVFGEVDPIGQRIWLSDEIRQVVGVVEDVPHDSRGSISRQAFILHGQADDRNWALVQTVKARTDLTALRDAIVAELAREDPLLVLYRPRLFQSVVDSVRAQDRFAMLLMGAFGLLALALALVGTYGVLARTVAGRTREIGIRMALGADVGSVRRLVLGQAAALTVPGIALGLLAAWLASRWVSALLFGVTPTDPLTFAVSAGVFLVVGLLAAWSPTLRATRVDALESLAAE
jgi:predicted permease